MYSEKIESKIIKLLKLQESAEKIGSLEEAANAAAKIQTLLLKHNLDMANLNIGKTEPEIDNEFTDFAEVYGWNKSSGPWMITLTNVIANNYLCKVVQSKGPKIMNARIFGKKENIEVVNMLLSQLIFRLKKMSIAAWSTYNGYEKKNAFLRGYLYGAVIGIHEKLKENKAAIERENIGMTALMVTSDKLVQQSVSDYYNGKLKANNRRVKTSAQDGRRRGYIDGKAMNINPALNR